MTTPNINIDVDMGALPEIKSYAAATEGGNVNLTGEGSFYLALPEGVSTITVSAAQSSLDVHLATTGSSSARYVSRATSAGQTLALSNVAVPAGETRYLHIRANGACDVGVTIITYPLT